MTKKTENNLIVVKRNIYTHDDSSKVFLLAILCPFILSFLLSYVAQTLATNWGIELTQITSNIWFNLISTLLSLALYVGIWWGYNKTKDISFSAANFRPKMKWHSYLILVAVAVVVIFGFQYIVQAFDYFLSWVGYPVDNGFGSVDPSSAGEYIYCIFALALIPAICEELIFRGVIFNGLRERFSSLTAVLISAGLFALAHQNLQQVIYPLIFGSILAIIVLRTGSLMASMVVHFVNNFIVVTMRFVTNMTGFSFSLPNTWWFYLVAIGTALVAFSICYLIDRFYFKHKIKDEITPTKTNISKYFYIALLVGAIMYVLSVVMGVMFA
ncbi:MAG: CPBP family intramembrane metalloprotease [Clostridia bacterium]|nr:CPBP family intramembrane metalloprotease [Clostridia bacterium]